MKKVAYTMGAASVALTVIGSLYKIMYWPGSDTLLIVGSCTLAIGVVPILIFTNYYSSKIPVMKKLAYILGSIFSSLIVLGSLFKIMHWPGAGIMLVIGMSCFAMFFLPLLAIANIKENMAPWNVIQNILGLLPGWTIVVGFLFKIMHWPGAGPMLVVGMSAFVMLWVPAFCINAIKGEGERSSHLLVMLSITAICLIMSMNVSKDLLESFVIVDDSIRKTNAFFTSQNASIYSQFDKARANDPKKIVHLWKQVMIAHKLSDEMYDHVEALKRFLIAQTDKTPYEAPDSLFALHNVYSKDNYDIPTHILIGDPGNPRRDKWSAVELKEKLNSYNLNLLGVIEDRSVAENMDLGLNTTDVKVSAHIYQPWETGKFYHGPLAAVVTMLSNIQTEVRYAEGTVIRQLYSIIPNDHIRYSE